MVAGSNPAGCMQLVSRAHLASVQQLPRSLVEPNAGWLPGKAKAEWFKPTTGCALSPPLAQQQSTWLITGRRGCDSLRADCDRGRSSRGTWMWTTDKRVRVPSITPCSSTEALTVKTTEIACKAVALEDNWVQVPAPSRTKRYAGRVRAPNQVSYARSRRCDSGLRNEEMPP